VGLPNIRDWFFLKEEKETSKATSRGVEGNREGAEQEVDWVSKSGENYRSQENLGLARKYWEPRGRGQRGEREPPRRVKEW